MRIACVYLLCSAVAANECMGSESSSPSKSSTWSAENANTCITLELAPNGLRSFLNGCPYDIEVAWCIGDRSTPHCVPNDSRLMPPNGSYPIVGPGDVYWFGACRGLDSIDMTHTSSNGIVCKG